MYISAGFSRRRFNCADVALSQFIFTDADFRKFSNKLSVFTGTLLSHAWPSSWQTEVVFQPNSWATYPKCSNYPLNECFWSKCTIPMCKVYVVLCRDWPMIAQRSSRNNTVWWTSSFSVSHKHVGTWHCIRLTLMSVVVIVTKTASVVHVDVPVCVCVCASWDLGAGVVGEGGADL